jgi:hypothetical protein
MTELSQALDQFSYQNLIGRKVGSDVPDLNGMTTATIERYIPWLNYNHEIASNTSLKNKNPYFREYSIPFYEPSERPQVQEIDLGYYDPDIEARYLYKVTHTYYEDQYSSTYPFYQWEYNRSQFRHELLKYKKAGTVVLWNRELLFYQHHNLPTQYQDLSNNGITFDISMNSGIGLNITSDCEFSVSTGDQTFSSDGKGSIHIPIVRNGTATVTGVSNNQIHQWYTQDIDIENYIRYTLNKGLSGDSYDNIYPTFFRIEILGEEIASRSYYPEGDIEELEATLIHRPNVPLKDRLIPPGKSALDPNFPTSFWNYNGPDAIAMNTSIASLAAAPSITRGE